MSTGNWDISEKEAKGGRAVLLDVNLHYKVVAKKNSMNWPRRRQIDWDNRVENSETALSFMGSWCSRSGPTGQ